MINERPAFGRILRAFAIAQVVAIAVPFVLNLFGIHIGRSSNLIGSFVAAMYAAHVFVKTHGRAPTAEERRRLVWLSFATCCAISLLLMVGLLVAAGGQVARQFFDELFNALPSVVFVIILLVVSALYLGAFHVAYGQMARSFEKKLAVRRP